jgi:cell division septation protein DedD
MSNEEDEDFANAGGITKWIPTIMLVSVITGFLVLSYFAYNSGRQSVKEDELLVVEAEKTPMKEKPADPGGMKFPNQDKTIFETFSNKQTPPQVERVLPPPEEPITRTEAIEAIVGKNADKSSGDSDKKEAIIQEETTSAPTEVATAEVAGSEDKKDEKPEVKAEEKTAPAKAPEKAAEKQSPAKGASGVKVQLGAYGSEAEAKEVWGKLQKKHSSLADKSPIIVRADLKAKGIFYRLRVGGFASKDAAKSFCKTLSDKGQACILATE